MKYCLAGTKDAGIHRKRAMRAGNDLGIRALARMRFPGRRDLTRDWKNNFMEHGYE